MPRINIVGLGPGPAEYVTAETLTLLHKGSPILASAQASALVLALAPRATVEMVVDPEPAWIANQLERMAATGPAVYAIKGSPLGGGAVNVVTRLETRGVEVQVHPALDISDLALALLRQDRAQVQILLGRESVRFDPQRALLFVPAAGDAQALIELSSVYPEDHEVLSLTAITSRKPRTFPTTVAELDASAAIDAVFFPPITPEQNLRRFDGLEGIIRRLHSPDGCPWDREQTHQSLRPHLLEESYELLEAIDSGESTALAEELGDVLLQVLMHAAVAERLGEFELQDVFQAISSKLVSRHPHVFAGASAASADEVRTSWDALKRKEQPDRSILDGVPTALPALAEAQTLQGRASRAGFDWPDVSGPLEKLAEEIGELARAENPEEREDEFGDVLFVIANLSQRMGIEAEQALRRANGKFRRRFGAVERSAREVGDELRDLNLDELNALWDQAKAAERPEL